MKSLTLTFDNGPTPGVTELVLDALAARDIRATFFLVGDQLTQPGARELAAAAADAGHWIGNHTMHHASSLGEWQDQEAAVAEVTDMHELLGPLASRPLLFRPAGSGRVGPHLFSQPIVEHLIEREYTVALWTVFVRDSEIPDGWAERALEAIGHRERDVLVIHDVAHGDLSQLPMFLDHALDRGFVMEQSFPDHVVPIEHGVATESGHALLPALHES